MAEPSLVTSRDPPNILLCLVLPPPGRATLHDKASLRIDQTRSQDQGWYECKVLMLEQQYDTFHNGSWVHLTVNGEETLRMNSHSLTDDVIVIGRSPPTGPLIAVRSQVTDEQGVSEGGLAGQS